MASDAPDLGAGTGGWRLDHSYAASLPAQFSTPVRPTPVAKPHILLLNHSLAEDLGLDPVILGAPEHAGWFTGNTLPPGASPIAQAYAGHQFGNFVILGDGRAILLGEQITPRGERFDIQLKGPGRTPYSRGGDGRAAVGPMLREYIISEAMHALKIPTTRSLAVALTGEHVRRDTMLPGAILTRVAASHIRVGTMEFAAVTGEVENLRELADYTIGRHYPELSSAEQPHLALFEAVMRLQAELIAKWQLVGFIHGVMNTDNMALSGETIDYGPCAFMDVYHPNTVFSSIDRNGRYAYSNQPLIAHWNLSRLASAMLPLFHESEEEAVKVANEKLRAFPELYQGAWLRGMRRKLGLFNEEPDDVQLAESLLGLMADEGLDFTNTFRDLSGDLTSAVRCAGSDQVQAWRERWQARLSRQSEDLQEAQKLMRANNPAFIPRNHKVEEALEAATNNDLGPLNRLLGVLANPFDYESSLPEFSEPSQGDTPYQTFCGT
ncbi:MAG TPA: YdiU family protein [Methylomirabilota bacterium]|nr:YdiU family protein [Methylomirabilota bacterium]